MASQAKIFTGNVHVYLQGMSALMPFGNLNTDNMMYYLGSKKSNLVIRDFRKYPIFVANHILSGQNGIEFADAFNTSAYAEVLISNENRKSETVLVDLYPGETGKDCPTLWMGVIENRLIPAYKIEWEFLRALNQDQIAFVILAE